MMIYLHLMQLEFGVTRMLSRRLLLLLREIGTRSESNNEQQCNALLNHHSNEKQTFTEIDGLQSSNASFFFAQFIRYFR